jgi:uncharacterized Zn finger protein
MTTNHIPTISEQEIAKLANSQSFTRGLEYYNEELIQYAIRQGGKLSGTCQGSMLYTVNVVLDNNSVKSSKCSCPYRYGGICKHLVAFLLTYVRQPDLFHVIPPVREILGKHTKDDLINLIEEMTENYPDLIGILQLSTPKSAKSQKSQQPIDLIFYTQKVMRVLNIEDYEDVEDAIDELHNFDKKANQLILNQDYLNAGNLYQLLLEAMNDNYDNDILMQIDYDGEICSFTHNFVEGLGKCLELGKTEIDEEQQLSWLFTLLDAFFHDLDLGGINYADNVDDYLLKYVNDQKWQGIEEEIKSRLTTDTNDWSQQAILNLLLEAKRLQNNSNEVEELIEKYSIHEEKVFLLLEKNKIAEAIEIAEKHLVNNSGIIEKFADALIERGLNDQALQLVLLVKHKNKGRSYDQWLKKYYKKYDGSHITWEWQEKLFWQEPSLNSYQGLANLGKKEKEKWQSLQNTIKQQLTEQEKWQLLIDIALLDLNIDLILDLLPKLDKQDKYTTLYKTIQTLKTNQPAKVIPIYQEFVETMIAERQRKSYQAAADGLLTIKQLYEKINQLPAWDKYIKELRSRYISLRAFNDELKKVRL